MRIIGSMIRMLCALGVYGFAFYGAFMFGPLAVVTLIVMAILGTDTDIWGHLKDRR